jgi:dimeric dUTPase (all-alpha-NTP-PPase superfamily)
LDLDKLYYLQSEFDKTFKEHEKEDSIKKKMFALLVEQGEAANEKPSIFKYWMSNPKGSSWKNAEKYAKRYNQPILPIKEDPALEELVDMLHFILSIGNDIGANKDTKNLTTYSNDNDVVDLHMHFAGSLTNLYFQWKSLSGSAPGSPLLTITYQQMFGLFLGIVKELGYSEEDLENAYYTKNKVNHERQKDGY